ncbi:MAG: AAA family ATPase [Bacilli bacterium]|nr:AAA family ATPase [Bacilli bacterium]
MIERTITKAVKDAIKVKPVTLITGARQVGKSTLCHELVKEMGFHYVTLDDLLDRSSALEDPSLFLKVHEAPLVIDEVQHAPRLFEVIECKSGVAYSKKDIRAFSTLRGLTRYEVGDSAVICSYDRVYAIDDGVFGLPLGAI